MSDTESELHAVA
jgi:nitrite reductase/ring-hydroxylating ferredoxin subunit